MDINKYITTSRNSALRELALTKNIAFNMQNAFVERAYRDGLRAKEFKRAAMANLTNSVLAAANITEIAVENYYSNRVEEYKKVLTSSKVAQKAEEYLSIYNGSLDTKIFGDTLEEISSARLGKRAAFAQITDNIISTFDEEQRGLKEQLKEVKARKATTDQQKQLKATEIEIINSQIFSDMEKTALLKDKWLPYFAKTFESELNKNFNSVGTQIAASARYNDIWNGPGTSGEKLNKFYDTALIAGNRNQGAYVIFAQMFMASGEFKKNGSRVSPGSVMSFLGTANASGFEKIEDINEDAALWLKRAYEELKNDPKKVEKLVNNIIKNSQVTEQEAAAITGKEVEYLTKTVRDLKVLEDKETEAIERDDKIETLEKRRKELIPKTTQKRSSYDFGERTIFGIDEEGKQREREQFRQDAKNNLKAVNIELEALKKEKKDTTKEREERTLSIEKLKKEFDEFKFEKIQRVAESGIVAVGGPTDIITNELEIPQISDLTNSTAMNQYAKEVASIKDVISKKDKQISMTPFNRTTIHQIVNWIKNGHHGNVYKAFAELSEIFKENGIALDAASATKANMPKLLEYAEEFLVIPANTPNTTQREKTEKANQQEIAENTVDLLRGYLNMFFIEHYPQQVERTRDIKDPETGRKSGKTFWGELVPSQGELLSPEGYPAQSYGTSETEKYIGKSDDMTPTVRNMKQAMKKYEHITKHYSGKGRGLNQDDEDELKEALAEYKINNPNNIIHIDSNSDKIYRIAKVFQQVNGGSGGGGWTTSVAEAMLIVDPLTTVQPTMVSDQGEFEKWYTRHAGKTKFASTQKEVIGKFISWGNNIKIVPLQGGQVGLIGVLRDGRTVDFVKPDDVEEENYNTYIENRYKELGIERYIYELYEAYLL